MSIIRLKAHLAYKERWQPETVSAALSRGKLFHAVMEAHYSSKATTLAGGGVEQTVDPWTVLDAALEAGVADEEFETVKWMYEGYLECHQFDSQWEILAVEQRVEDWLRTPSGGRSSFKLKGFVDLLVRDHSAGGGLWIVDHKDQPLDSLLPAPNGTISMGDIQHEQTVIGSDGLPTEVLGVFPQGRSEVWSVHLDDGAVVHCGPQHLWEVGREGMEARKVMTTSNLRDQVDSKGRHVYLPIGAGVQYEERSLPLDPYLLGALLGDGCLIGTPRLSSHADDDQELRGYCDLRGDTWDGHRALRGNCYTTNIVGGLTRTELERMGLRTHGLEKHIPQQYLCSAAVDRLALLQGLMDTDGNVSAGKARYCTSAPELRDGVIQLVRSLGGTSRAWSFTSDSGRTAWQVWVWLQAPIFRLKRKSEGWAERSQQKRHGRRVVGVEFDGFEETQCIQVEADDGLYYTGADGGYVLTHNTCRELPKGKALEFDDQFGIYVLLMRRLGYDIRGVIYNACRSYKLKRAMDLKERFKREYTVRTDHELEVMAGEALQTFKSAYGVGVRGQQGGSLPPRSPDPDRCGWRCPFTEACLMSRKGRDIHELLTETGFTKRPERH